MSSLYSRKGGGHFGRSTCIIFTRDVTIACHCHFSGDEDHCLGPSRRHVSCNTQVNILHSDYTLSSSTGIISNHRAIPILVPSLDPLQSPLEWDWGKPRHTSGIHRECLLGAGHVWVLSRGLPCSVGGPQAHAAFLSARKGAQIFPGTQMWERKEVPIYTSDQPVLWAPPSPGETPRFYCKPR